MLNTKKSTLSTNQKIILFDGVCNLCNGFVQFVLKIDTHKIFLFSSLQSEFGQNVLKRNLLSSTELTSVILLDKHKIYKKSEAVLQLFRLLGGFWSVLYLLIIIPSPIRDWVYTKIAQNRYSWFGKKESCWLPTPELKSRFI